MPTKTTVSSFSNTVEYQDAPLLAEANYECPLCHKKLVDSIKGQAVKKYRITQVFPAGLKEETAAEFAAVYPIPIKLDAPENLIALDEDCAERYLLSPTAEEYGKLHEIKTQLTKNYAAKLSVSDVQLEDDIRTILSALGTIKNASELVELEYRDMIDNISRKLHSDETVKKAAETIVETVETEKLNAEKDSIEGSVRDHLRGFSRTIPAFLMAYGDENTTLANFDALVPDEVFWEVTVNPQNGQGVTLDQFRMLRDGGDYVSESGEQKHFDGHLFDEVVFNDAVQEFMKKRAELANYFEPDHKGDIFDFIPPQRTNQIFTPKKVVKDMVDRLEQENPGCFDDPDATFADLYMKSGMYVTEIVTRLYQSKRMKALYPDDAERLNHIFAKQVFGCAPTEIIYRICLRYILGFSDEIRIAKNNIRLCDTLEYAKNGTMDAEMRKLFDL